MTHIFVIKYEIQRYSAIKFVVVALQSHIKASDTSRTNLDEGIVSKL